MATTTAGSDCDVCGDGEPSVCGVRVLRTMLQLPCADVRPLASPTKSAARKTKGGASGAAGAAAAGGAGAGAGAGAGSGSSSAGGGGGAAPATVHALLASVRYTGLAACLPDEGLLEATAALDAATIVEGSSSSSSASPAQLMALASVHAEALDQAVSKVATAAQKTLAAATTASGARLLLLRALDAVQRAAVDIEVAGAMLRSMFARAVTAVLDKVAARHPRLVSADQRKTLCDSVAARFVVADSVTKLRAVCWSTACKSLPAQAKGVRGGTGRDSAKASDVRSELDIGSLKPGSVDKFWLSAGTDAMGTPIVVPVVVVRGARWGHTVGVVAALHGNEINGTPAIHSALRSVDPKQVCGTIIAVPVLNPEGYRMNQRRFGDGSDLNRMMPGKVDGTTSQQFAFHIFNKIIRQCEVLLDLHTAGFGKLNSYYIRASMSHPVVSRMAILMRPHIIAHSNGPKASLRLEATKAGVPTVCVEIGHPQVFLPSLITRVSKGILECLRLMSVIGPADTVAAGGGTATAATAVSLPDRAGTGITGGAGILPHATTSKSGWIYTSCGGILRVKQPLNSWVVEGTEVARVTDLFGDTVERITAPHSGVLIGKASNPAGGAGSRVCHIGVCKELPEVGEVKGGGFGPIKKLKATVINYGE